MSFGTSGRPPKVIPRMIRCAGCGTSYDFHRERCRNCRTLTADSADWWALHFDPPKKRPILKVVFVVVLAGLVWAVGYTIVALLN